jgi:serine/threonine protein kinase
LDLNRILSNFTLRRELFIKQKEGDINEHYDLGKKLGEGAFGKVFQAFEKGSGELRAIK